MSNIEHAENTPIHQPGLMEKVTETPPKLPEGSDKVIGIAPKLLNESEFTKAVDPQLPRLDHPINVTEPDIEQVQKVLGQTKELLSGSNKDIPLGNSVLIMDEAKTSGVISKIDYDISHSQPELVVIDQEEINSLAKSLTEEQSKFENLAEPKLMIMNEAIAARLEMIHNYIADGKLAIAVLDKNAPDGVNFIHAGNVELPALAEVYNDPNSKFAELDLKEVRTVGFTEEDHEIMNNALNKFKESDGISPKLKALLETEGKTHIHQDRESFFNAIVEAYTKGKTESAEDKSKEHGHVAEAHTHRYTSNHKESLRAPEIKHIAANSFKGVEVAALFTIVSTRNFTDSLRKSNEEVKEKQDQEVKEEIRKDQMMRTEGKEDEAAHRMDKNEKKEDETNRNIVKDSLKLRYRQVIEEMAKIPNAPKPSQTV